MFCPDYGNFNYSFLLLLLLITQSLQLYSRVGSWLSIYLFVSSTYSFLFILIKPAEKAVKRDTVRTFSNIFYSCIPQFSCFFLHFGPEQAYDDWFVTKYFHLANHSSKNAKIKQFTRNCCYNAQTQNEYLQLFALFDCSPNYFILIKKWYILYSRTMFIRFIRFSRIQSWTFNYYSIKFFI